MHILNSGIIPYLSMCIAVTFQSLECPKKFYQVQQCHFLDTNIFGPFLVVFTSTCVERDILLFLRGSYSITG